MTGAAPQRRVLVTGGGQGIGRALARAFAAQGDAVTITGRRAAPLAETAEGWDMAQVVADVTDEAATEALFDRPFDVVIANAGGGQAGKLSKTSLDDWNRTLATNLTGTFLTFRAALRGMGAGGRLIAIASTASLRGGASIAAYAAAKHGVLGLVRSVALEVGPRGITCNAICPGFVDTPLADQAAAGLQARFGIDRDQAVARLVADSAAGRLVSPDEVAAAALYLAAPPAAMVNAHALELTGGTA